MEMAATGDQAGFSSATPSSDHRGFDPGASIQELGRLGGWHCSEMLQDRLAGTGKPILSGLL